MGVARCTVARLMRDLGCIGVSFAGRMSENNGARRVVGAPVGPSQID